MSRRVTWSVEEKEACVENFQRFLFSGTLPGKKQITDIQSKTPVLEDRTWIQIKNYLRNTIKKAQW